MKKNEWIIIGGAVGVILLSGVYLFRDEVTVDYVPVISESKMTHDIERNKSEIYIYNLSNAPKHLDWSEDLKLKMDNISSLTGKGNFTFDLEQLTVERQEVIDREKVYINDVEVDSFIVLDRLSETRDLIFIQDEAYRGIYRYNYAIQDIRKVTEAMKCDENDVPLGIMSEDKSKYLYVEDGRNRLVTYTFKNGYKTILSRYYTDEDMDDFYNRFDIASNGGYIIDNDYKNNEISIMGADSGRFYANKLIGKMPVINDKITFMNYIYVNEDNETILGQLDFGTGKINYIKMDRMIIPESIKGIGNDLLYVAFNEASGSYELMKYNYKSQSEEVINVFDQNSPEEFTSNQFMAINEIYIVYDENATRFIHSRTGESINFTDLEMFMLNGKEGYHHPLSEGVIFKDKNIFYLIEEGGYKKLFDTEEEVVETYSSVGGQYLLVVTQDASGKINMTISENIE